jgi:uncharacterized RDD family membrane protein YckC
MIITPCEEIPLGLKMATGSSSELDMNHWLYRFLAFVIDSIITAIPAYIIFWLVFIPLFWSESFLGITIYYTPWWSYYLLFPLLYGIILVIYSAILDVSWNATVGKRVLGLQVQMVNGSKVQFGAAFIRDISKIYWLFLLLDWIIGIATPGPDRRQKYTDRMAGTTVVSVRQPFPTAPPPPPPPPPS